MPDHLSGVAQSGEPSSPLPDLETRFHRRGWIFAEGVFFMAVGGLAIFRPALAGLALTQLLGILSIFAGVFAVGGAVFNNPAPHRLSVLFSGALFIAAGAAILWVPADAVLTIALIIGVLLPVDGLSNLIAAFQRRTAQKGWWWLLINGVLSITLGCLIFSGWPSTESIQIVGVLCCAFLAIAVSGPKPLA